MKSIRQRLTWSILSGFGLLLICSSLAIYFMTRATLLDEFDAGLRAKALTLLSLAEQGQNGIHLELPDELFQETNNDAAPRFFELWQLNGNVIARSSSLKDTHLPLRFGPTDRPAYWNVDLPDDQDGRAIGVKFTPQAEDEDAQKAQPAEAILVVAANRESLDSTLDILAGVLVVTGLLTVLVTVPMVKLALRRGHAPLGQLGRQAAAITADTLQMRFPVDALPEELQPITARLNDLLARLESSFERERRFSADLAHELRTPLAELRTHAEVELKWSDGEEAEKHQETLNIALQMEAMVTRLLELARCENGKVALQLESVTVAQLVEEVWRPLSAKATAKQLDFQFCVPPDAAIQTDRTFYRSVLTNLLSNAVEYTPLSGRIDIRWQTDARALDVSNTVSDLGADDVPHLFERLWRKDTSRTGGEHCGLGLSVSRAFAELLGWSLTAHFSDPKTLTLVLKQRKA